MKLLIVHNRYIHRGGEDVCVDNEIGALRQAGVAIVDFQVQSDASLIRKTQGLSSPFSNQFQKNLLDIMHRERPDILHAHNLFPLLSPRVFAQAKRQSIATVLTLHNFRPLCLNGLFLTPDHEVCERCLPGNYWPGIVRGCYRDSPLQSLWLASHLTLAKWQSWYDQVDQLIAPSEFLKNKFIEAGWSGSRIEVQGHFIPDLTTQTPIPPDPYILYLGRLSEEKGVPWILDVFRDPPMPIKLLIAGQGPLEERVRQGCGPHISYSGYLEGKAKEKALRHALALVMPSECYENFPLAVAEANAWGVPALVCDEGGLKELVRPGVNGERFARRDMPSFWSAVERIIPPNHEVDFRRSAQDYARERFSKDRFLTRRLALYDRVSSLSGLRQCVEN